MAKGSVYEGKTFEEAVRIGLDDLGLSRAEATITVIEEGKGGFLGFGARPFRVSIMRRPGGAVREPEEQRERRVSGGRRDDRRGGRGGRDRDRGGRDRDRDREGGGRRREEGEREKRREQPARAEGGRGEERRGERREGREGREPRESREPREPREVRAEGREESRREGRREGRREERREQPARAEGGRGEERRAERREERRPAAAEPPAVSAGADEAAGAEGGDASERRRRRRGRRGGRGRRREGVAGAPGEMVAGSVNGTESETEAFEPAESFAPHEAFEERRELETGDAPVEAVSAPAEVRAEAEPHPQAVAVAAAVETAEEPALASGELAETSRRLTEELLRAMGFEATVTVKTDGNRADVTAEIAKDEELLTGQKGEVRQALQHLLNRFVNRGEGSRYHLQLEINDFWQRRERELEDLARSLADQAASENAEVVTDYLNSQERRIVHVTLKEDERVRTYSLGDGMIKRIAIAPAAFPDRTGEEDAG